LIKIKPLFVLPQQYGRFSLSCDIQYGQNAKTHIFLTSSENYLLNWKKLITVPQSLLFQGPGSSKVLNTL